MLKQSLCAYLLCVFFVSAKSTTTESPDDVLSKTDATRVFSQSFDTWRNQTALSQTLGVGHTKYASTYEITLYIKTSGGLLAVTPTYTASNQAKPNRIVVSVLQNPAVSAITRTVSDAGLLDMIAQTQSQMLPEFTVLGKMDLSGGHVQLDFFIFEVGVHPLLDDLAIKAKGCWEKCIVR